MSDTIPIMPEGVGLRDGVPCGHPGCLSHVHVSHPCEGCGRVNGVAFDLPMERVCVITRPPDVDATPPPKVNGFHHPEPVNPRAFGEAIGRRKRGRK